MEDYLTITTSVDLLRIAAGELVYAEAHGNYTTLVLSDGDRRVVSLQLGQLERLIEQQIPQHAHGFVRIGKSLIVRLSSVRYLQPTQGKIELVGHHKLEASHEALKQLKDMLCK